MPYILGLESRKGGSEHHCSNIRILDFSPGGSIEGGSRRHSFNTRIKDFGP